MIYILIFILLFWHQHAISQNPLKTLYTVAQKCLNHPNLKHGQWSTCAYNTENDKIILDINSEKSLIPASNLKLVTSSAALCLLGENETFQTYLEHSGTIDKNGQLNGNIYIRGEGDPTLGSSHMPEVLDMTAVFQLWINIIKSKGIQKINGHIFVDNSYFDHMPIPGEWLWMDIGNYYAPPTSAICINENSYELFFKSPDKLQMIADIIRTKPEIPDLSFQNHMKTGKVRSGARAFIYGAPGQWNRTLDGLIPAGKNEFSIEGSIPDPALFVARFLKIKLEEEHIIVQGEATVINKKEKEKNKRYLMHTIQSPPLKDIIHQLNKSSVNLYAEQLIKIIAKKKTGDTAFDKGIILIKDWLRDKGLSTKGVFMHDGSGLSRLNGCTTRFFVELLAMMSKNPSFNILYDSLPVAGNRNDQGNLKTMCLGTTAENNVRAKTGSMERVRCHSGYVHSKSGELICFSIMANNYTGKSRIIDKIHESIMVSLSELE